MTVPRTDNVKLTYRCMECRVRPMHEGNRTPTELFAHRC